MRFSPFMSHYSLSLSWKGLLALKKNSSEIILSKFHRKKKKTGGEVRSTNTKSNHAILESQTALKPTYNRPFQLLTWTRLRNSVGTTGKSALESIKRLSLKLTKIQLLKVTNISPTIQTFANFRNFVELYLRPLNPLSPNSAQN